MRLDLVRYWDWTLHNTDVILHLFYTVATFHPFWETLENKFSWSFSNPEISYIIDPLFRFNENAAFRIVFQGVWQPIGRWPEHDFVHTTYVTFVCFWHLKTQWRTSAVSTPNGCFLEHFVWYQRISIVIPSWPWPCLGGGFKDVLFVPRSLGHHPIWLWLIFLQRVFRIHSYMVQSPIPK